MHDNKPIDESAIRAIRESQAPSRESNGRKGEGEIRKFAETARNFQGFVSIVAINGKLVFINDAGGRIVGVAPEDASRHSLIELLSKDCRDKGRDVLNAILEQGSWTGDLRFLSLETGRQADVQTIAFLIRSRGTGKPLCIALVSLDMNEHRLLEEKLERVERVRKESNTALTRREVELEELKMAMKVLLKYKDDDRAEAEMNILANIKESVLPYIEKLKSTKLSEDQKGLVSFMESRLADITSTFIRELSSGYIGLSPAEKQVATLIREGKATKEIASMLGISHYTVMSHRYCIRKKTGVKGTKINLRSYLQQLK